MDDAAVRRVAGGRGARLARGPAGPPGTPAGRRGPRDARGAEEQPGRIIHELRRHGGAGPFSSRSRYYGTVDATPLFVALTAEEWRGRGLDDEALRRLAVPVARALDWMVGPGDTNGDGFIDYQRRDPRGLA